MVPHIYLTAVGVRVGARWEKDLPRSAPSAAAMASWSQQQKDGVGWGGREARSPFPMVSNSPGAPTGLRFQSTGLWFVRDPSPLELSTEAQSS